jgi:hypothetical protein
MPGASDVLAVAAHGDGDRVVERRAVGTGPAGAGLADAAGGARELGQGSGRLVPGEDRDGIAEERRDVQTTDPARLPGDTDRRQTEYSTAGRK